MGISYSDVLKRLIEERHRLGWSQYEISQCICMSQSDYNKVEHGRRRLSYCELKGLCDSEIDVNYIYTNQRSIGRYIDFFNQCNFSELLSFYSVLYAVRGNFCRNAITEQKKVAVDGLKYIRLIEDRKSFGEILFALRKANDWQQQKMAEKMGVDVKKLRGLENGKILPDCELLFRIYNLFHVVPSIILKDKKGMASDISILMEMMGTEDGDKLFKILKIIRDMNNYD